MNKEKALQIIIDAGYKYSKQLLSGNTYCYDNDWDEEYGTQLELALDIYKEEIQ